MKQSENFCMPISHQQEYIMYGENYGNRNAKSILVEGRKLIGNLDLSLLKESIFKVVENNTALRMICVNNEDKFYLKLKDNNYTDIFFSSEFNNLDDIKNDTIKSLDNSMELDKELFKVRIYTLNPSEHILIIVMHHLIADSVTLSIVLSEILQTYSGKEVDKTETAGYLEFLREEQAFYESETGKVQIEYWTNEMKDYVTPEGDGGGEWFDVIKDSSFYISNKELSLSAAKLKVSPFVLLLSAVHIAIGRMYNITDTTVGIAFANRVKKKYRNTVGYLAHMIQNRIICDERENTTNFIEKVSFKMSENIKHQRLSHYVEPARINIGVQDNQLSHNSEFFDGNIAEKINFDIERSIDYILIGVNSSVTETRINLFCDPNVYSKDFVIRFKELIYRSVNEIIKQY